MGPKMTCTVTDPRIGLALSGGGFRATAFGLGCLRALHDTDLLRHVAVVSGISGGSLLTAMWAYGPADFIVSTGQLLNCLVRVCNWSWSAGPPLRPHWPGVSTALVRPCSLAAPNCTTEQIA